MENHPSGNSGTVGLLFLMQSRYSGLKTNTEYIAFSFQVKHAFEHSYLLNIKH